MKSEDIKKAPKPLCESVNIGYTPEYFALALSSGSENTVFSFTPQHAKRLQQYLAHEVSNYEEKHGEINATWNPNVVSPVQRANPPRDGS